MAPKLFNKKDDLHTISLGINYFDAEGLKTRFRMTVIDKVKKARVIVSQFLKDSSPTAATAKTVWTGGGVSHSSNIKREAVQLPKFSRDKMAGHAFFKYPIWLKNWKSQILEYEEKYRASMLMTLTNSEAQKYCWLRKQVR